MDYITDRQEMIDGLREAADFLEARPGIEVWAASSVAAHVVADNAEHLAQVARALGKADKDFDGEYVRVERKVGPVIFGAFASRNRVCERVVIGTETGEAEVEIEPAKTETQTVEREKVEWRCEPLLKA